MRNFDILDSSPESFAERAARELRARGYDDVVSLRLDGFRLWVWFDKMGRTELVYRLCPMDGGFSAELEGQKLATFHAPFVAAFESQFEEVINGAGGRLQ